DGAPVGGGTIQVLIEDPRSRRLLGSAVTSVTDKGTFSVEFKESQFVGSRSTGMRVTGQYTGRVNDKDNKPQALKGTATVYVNMTPPWGWGFGWGFGVVLVPLLALVVLFTGPLPPR